MTKVGAPKSKTFSTICNNKVKLSEIKGHFAQEHSSKRLEQTQMKQLHTHAFTISSEQIEMENIPWQANNKRLRKMISCACGM